MLPPTLLWVPTNVRLVPVPLALIEPLVCDCARVPINGKTNNKVRPIRNKRATRVVRAAVWYEELVFMGC